MGMLLNGSIPSTRPLYLLIATFPPRRYSDLVLQIILTLNTSSLQTMEARIYGGDVYDV